MAKLYFRYSAMNAGKSTALIQVAYNYEERGMRVEILTAAIDHRHGVGNVTSRLGVQRSAEIFTNQTDFYAALSRAKAGLPIDENQLASPIITEKREDVVPLACVLIDEAQFLTPAQVEQIHRFAHLEGVPVICYGIRSDFRGQPFPGAAQILTLADSIEELKTICACGRKATMNVRIDASGRRITEGAQVAIEGNVRYTQTCARCFYEGAPVTSSYDVEVCE